MCEAVQVSSFSLSGLSFGIFRRLLGPVHVMRSDMGSIFCLEIDGQMLFRAIVI